MKDTGYINEAESVCIASIKALTRDPFWPCNPDIASCLCELSVEGKPMIYHRFISEVDLSSVDTGNLKFRESAQDGASSDKLLSLLGVKCDSIMNWLNYPRNYENPGQLIGQKIGVSINRAYQYQPITQFCRFNEVSCLPTAD